MWTGRKSATSKAKARGHCLIAITGGGTGGHVYPALAVVELLRLPDRSLSECVIWIGSRRGLEREIVEKRGIRFFGISTGKLRRYFSLRNLFDVLAVLAGFFESLWLLAKQRPRVLFAKGGYVSVPPVVAAKILGIRVICHESDLDPGLATRINSRFADEVLVPFPESVKYFGDSTRVRVVGVPIRNDLAAGRSAAGKAFAGSDGSKPMLLVVGGSLGAKRINDFVDTAIGVLTASWVVVHQTGSSGAAGASGDSIPRYRRCEYLGAEYPDLVAAADCVLCRAGATTLWECAAMGRAMVLVPLGLDSSRGDQLRNAAYFGERGAALVHERTPIDRAELLEVLDRLAGDPLERERLGRRARSLVNPDAAAEIARLIETFCPEDDG